MSPAMLSLLEMLVAGAVVSVAFVLGARWQAGRVLEACRDRPPARPQHAPTARRHPVRRGTRW